MVRVLIRCVVTGQEGALAERPCVLSAASSMAPGIVLAPSQRVKTLRQRQGLVTLFDPKIQFDGPPADVTRQMTFPTSSATSNAPV